MDRSVVTYTRRGEPLIAEVSGEIVALDVENGRCYGFNEVASRVWNLLDQPRSLSSICEALTREYEVDPSVCHEEVEGLLNSLVSEGFVSRSTA